MMNRWSGVRNQMPGRSRGDDEKEPVAAVVGRSRHHVLRGAHDRKGRSAARPPQQVGAVFIGQQIAAVFIRENALRAVDLLHVVEKRLEPGRPPVSYATRASSS